MSETDERRTAPVEAPHLDGGRPDEWRMPPPPYQPPPPAPPFSWPTPPPSTEARHEHHEFHHPLDRVTGRLPRRVRIAVDWIVTIVGAVAIVLGIKAYGINPYRIPSSSMEATLHCARPAAGCESRFSDRVLANRFIYHFRDPRRGEIVVFETPPRTKAACNAGGTFVKRIIGLPGETVQIRLRRGAAFVFIDGRRLEEPYIEHDRRDIGPEDKYKVPAGSYFMMGDNRSQSCDSRQWGSVPRENLIGPVFMTYWPPQRISFR
ncbi:MAG TPA: signal peptidase I [Gaiellaceae bacterium]|nr:signal peptidase I [Gaiellaceae bacterium]